MPHSPADLAYAMDVCVTAQGTIELKPFSGSNVSAVHRAKHLVVCSSLRGRLQFESTLCVLKWYRQPNNTQVQHFFLRRKLTRR